MISDQYTFLAMTEPGGASANPKCLLEPAGLEPPQNAAKGVADKENSGKEKARWTIDDFEIGR